MFVSPKECRRRHRPRNGSIAWPVARSPAAAASGISFRTSGRRSLFKQKQSLLNVQT